MDRRHVPVHTLFYRIALSTQTVTGRAYLRAVARAIMEGTDVAGVFVSEASVGQSEPGRVTLWTAGANPGAETNASGEPWFTDDAGGSTYIQHGAAAVYPDDEILGETHAETFLAVPLASLDGACIGYVGIISARALSTRQANDTEALLRLVAPRACAELDRLRIERTLSWQGTAIRHLAQAADEAVLVWESGPPPSLRFVSDLVERVTGYTATEVRANPEFVLSPILSALQPSAATTSGQTGDVRLLRKDGVVTRLEAQLSVEVDGEHAHFTCRLRPWPRPALMQDIPSAGDLTIEVLESVETALIVVRDDTVAYMNKRAGDLTGCTAADVLALRIVVQSAGSDLSLTLGDWTKRLRRSRNVRTIIRLRTRRNTERALEIRSRVTPLTGGTAVVLMATDVTEHRRRDEELEEHALLKHSILESIPFQSAALDRRGEVIWVNDRWSAAAKSRAGSLLCQRPVAVGDNFLEQCRRAVQSGAPGAEETRTGVASVLSGGVPGFVTEYECSDDDGTVHTFLVTATPLVERDGAVVVHGETTRLTRRTRQISERESHMRGLIASLPDQVARMTTTGHVVEVLGPGSRSPMMPLFQGTPFKKHIRDVLPGAPGENLLKALHEAEQANTMTVSLLHVGEQDDEREYEARILPLAERDMLVTFRDRTSERWAPSSVEDERGGGPRPRIVQQNLYGLTFREVAVLELMSHGSSDKEIASRLGVSVFTVNKHVSKILHKMGAASRTEASIRTLREGLFAS